MASIQEEANMAAVQNVPFTLGIYASKHNFMDLYHQEKGWCVFFLHLTSCWAVLQWFFQVFVQGCEGQF